MSEAEPAVLALRLAVVVRVNFGQGLGDSRPDPFGDDCAARSTRYLARTVPGDPAGAFWRELAAPDPGQSRRVATPFDLDAAVIRELDPAFQAVLSPESKSPWRARWLGAAPEVLALLHAGRCGAPSWKPGFPLPKLTDLTLALFPLEMGFLVFRFSWPAGEGALPTAREAVAQVSALRHLNGAERVWSFAGSEAAIPAHEAPEDIRRALAGGAGVPLRSLAGWLSAQTSAEWGAPPDRTLPGRFAFTQAAVVLPAPPDKAELHRLLFWLRRGVSDEQIPPTEMEPDSVLETRGNRRLAVSREGVASVSWLDPGLADAGARKWDREVWPGRVTGMYLVLTLHALAERYSLALLARDAMAAAAPLKGTADLARNREPLTELALKMSRYTLSMVGEDPGGITEYAWFFASIRKILGTAAQLDEVRGEIEGIAGLVDAAHDRTIAQLGAWLLPGATLAALLGINRWGADLGSFGWLAGTAVAGALGGLLISRGMQRK